MRGKKSSTASYDWSHFCWSIIVEILAVFALFTVIYFSTSDSSYIKELHLHTHIHPHRRQREHTNCTKGTQKVLWLNQPTQRLQSPPPHTHTQPLLLLALLCNQLQVSKEICFPLNWGVDFTENPVYGAEFGLPTGVMRPQYHSATYSLDTIWQYSVSSIISITTCTDTYVRLYCNLVVIAMELQHICSLHWIPVQDWHLDTATSPGHHVH